MNVLPTDIPLDKCPAPIDLCFLANLIQLGRICPSVNASDRDRLDVNGKCYAKSYNVMLSIPQVFEN